LPCLNQSCFPHPCEARCDPQGAEHHAASEAKLRAYIVYYTEQQGLDPKQAPTEADTIVALIESFLTRDSGFNRYLREKAP
jgi:hypothetical protein